MEIMKKPNVEMLRKLREAKNIWFASVRPDGRPHLTPVWFVLVREKLFISIDPNSVKNRNLASNAYVALALEEGIHPVICEGRAEVLGTDIPVEVLARFQEKYEWDVPADAQYNQVIEVTPVKWMAW
jgi:F420H(2)-dependent biliverdin reductase